MTNKVVLRTIEQFMADYTPIYQPIYPLFLGNSQSYSEEVGKLTFKRLNAVGDIRSRHITPKDTEIKQISAAESSKVFKKYFLASQFTQSALQDAQGVEDVYAQILDEHQRHADDLLLLGEGTSGGDVINNALFWSADPNYILEGSATVDGDGVDPLISLHTNVMISAQKANALAGRKIIMFYGEDVLPLFNSLYTAQPIPFKRTLAEVLGANYSFVEMPADVTPAGANGWIVANLDQVKLHYTALPSLKDQGVNSEKMYAWSNFLMGSMMVDVKAENGIIRQPATVDLGS
jgi:hypothetical protein